jgi:hypothetical protein
VFTVPSELAGLDMRETAQEELFKELVRLYLPEFAKFHYEAEAGGNPHYFITNNFFNFLVHQYTCPHRYG